MIGGVSVIPNGTRIDRVEAFALNADGTLRLTSIKDWKGVTTHERQLFGNKHALYLFPTVELVDWVREQIAGRHAIEIGSGNGCLGRSLGIPRTDSYIQATPDVAFRYRLFGQPTVRYGNDVEKYEALAAVAHYRPQVVVGSWISDLDTEGTGRGSPFGVDEVVLYDMLPSGGAYIHIGNAAVHGAKRLLDLTRRLRPRSYTNGTLGVPFVVSRAAAPDLDIIYVWEKP